MVTQNNESSKFLLWDRECAELIGETADDVNRVKIEVCSCFIICCFSFYVLRWERIFKILKERKAYFKHFSKGGESNLSL